MTYFLTIPFILLLLSSSHVIIRTVGAYEPTWESLDSRPLPSWYPDAKFGIFLHWGVFSVPAYGSEWFWKNMPKEEYQIFINKTENPYRFAYPDYAHRFGTSPFFSVFFSFFFLQQHVAVCMCVRPSPFPLK